MILENVQQQKLLTNIDGYITAVWGVEPYNLSSSVFITAAVFTFSEWLKLDFMVKSTVGKDIMIYFVSIINSHNNKILNENIGKPTSASCNCRVKASCPLDGNCLQSSLVYICKAATPSDYPHYIGLTENTFKDRLYKHIN